MPGVTLHFVLADRVLQRWRGATAPPPFDPSSSRDLNAFFHGAVGPDLGYFPGGDRLLSDLAHCVRTGELVRALVRSAASAQERAFAWGWLTHVLGDQAIHPIIGRGVGEMLTGSRDHFVDGASNMPAHLRVEMGLDAWYAERFPDVCGRRITPFLYGRGVNFLTRAYAATYRTAVEGWRFIRSHDLTSRRVGQALATMPLVGALMKASRPVAHGQRCHALVTAVRGVLDAAYRKERLRSAGLACLVPVTPSPWLLDEVADAVDAHAGRFMEHFETQAMTLQDLNLDTGRLLRGEVGHLGTRRALEGLAGLAGASAAA